LGDDDVGAQLAERKRRQPWSSASPDFSRGLQHLKP
jgi:hypothetical protein